MIHSAAFSASISVGALVLPLVMVGMAPASTTRSPAMPRTRSCGSSTAIGTSSRPIFVVPVGWKMGVAMSPARRAGTSAAPYCTPALHFCRLKLAPTGGVEVALAGRGGRKAVQRLAKRIQRQRLHMVLQVGMGLLRVAAGEGA